MASIRSDEGMPIFVGNRSNVQDGVVLHALETIDEEGKPVEKNLVEVGGKKYAVYIGENVSLAHQSQVHGPASVGNDPEPEPPSPFSHLDERKAAIYENLRDLQFEFRSSR
jgi:carbonic anhydrase/acetyltransferase-like protein (isoleucine patch superfamily)